MSHSQGVEARVLRLAEKAATIDAVAPRIEQRMLAPREGEILIEIRAAAINPSDAKAHFERLVDKEKANELRYHLARKFFDDGKHLMAKVTAKQLLDEGPQKEFVNKLYGERG